jgi:hypothetical protein
MASSDVHPDDIIQTRKAHPCGGDTWRVVRVGAEIGLRCQTCGRKVWLARSTFERRLKRVVQRNAAGDHQRHLPPADTPS